MMFMESGHDGQSEQKTFEKMLAYNPAAIIQFNIDTIESCTQLLPTWMFLFWKLAR